MFSVYQQASTIIHTAHAVPRLPASPFLLAEEYDAPP